MPDVIVLYSSLATNTHTTYCNMQNTLVTQKQVYFIHRMVPPTSFIFTMSNVFN